MVRCETGEFRFGVPDVRYGEVGEEDGLVVGGEEQGGEGPLVVVCAGILQEGEGVGQGFGDEGVWYGDGVFLLLWLLGGLDGRARCRRWRVVC